MHSEKTPFKPTAIQFAIGHTCEHAKLDYITEHVVCHVISGEMRVTEYNKQTIYGAGNTFLLRRNGLIKCERKPGEHPGQFKVIFIVLRKEFLEHFSLLHETKSDRYIEAKPQVLLLKNTPSIIGLFNSLVPYLEAHTIPSLAITENKLHELLICLYEQSLGIDDWLFDQVETGTLDLAEFMERNFMFNVPISKFAELSGRSVWTFQRHFLKIFGLRAGTWLLQRRLQAAHEMLLNSDRKPSQIYIEIGFEDFSHFSKSFKKFYGYNASKTKIFARQTKN